ncbi:hypothetical protein [Streptomyces sp. CNQ085]|uniref:hypothetical protein n=1 Tax=Streptomyces sp. CNQ085 TaxID=2886944 RepID=UPI001F505B19|nr:hypothetical protein [Streptomyces sp. CNQ085]MCI0385975.1 hypothetical protein [Streptomyces sp. CNQ085]
MPNPIRVRGAAGGVPPPGSRAGRPVLRARGEVNRTGVPNDTRADAVIGETRQVADGALAMGAPGKGDLRVYLLNGPGKTGADGPCLK